MKAEGLKNITENVKIEGISKNKKLFVQGEKHPSFALRKLTIGVVSVLVGILFATQTGPVVHAAGVNTNSGTARIENVQTNSNEQKQSLDENQADSKTDISHSDPVNDDKQEIEVKVQGIKQENAETDQDIPTSEAKPQETTPVQTPENKKVETPDSTKSEQGKQEKSNPTATSVPKDNTSKDNTAESTQAKPEAKPEAKTDADAINTKLPDDQNLTREDVLHALELDRPDISDADLAKIGLKNGEYYFNGNKYGLEGWAEAVPADKSKEPLIFKGLLPHHNTDGTIYWPNSDSLDDSQVVKNYDINFEVQLIPIVTANGTVIAHVDQKLTPEDAKGAVDTADKDELRFKWDTSDPTKIVDTSKPGVQTGTVVVIYKSGVNMDPTNPEKPVDKYIYTNVKVTVLEPLVQNTITLWQGDDTPSSESVVNNHVDLTNKIPGTTFTWAVVPDTKTPTDENGKVYQVITHWPDKTTTARDVTVIVKQLIKDVTETKQATRDIYVQRETDTPVKYDTQTVTMTRKGQQNLKTNQTTWGAWTPAQMVAYTAPTIKGYTVTNPDAAPAISLDGAQTSLGSVIFIYSKTGSTTPSVTPSKGPTDPTQPTQPTQPTSPTAPAPHDEITPSSEVDEVTNVEANPTNVAKVKEAEPSDEPVRPLSEKMNRSEKVTPTVKPTAMVHHTAKNNTPITKVKVATVKANKNELPQTGSINTENLGVIGLAVAAIGALLGLTDFKKRKE
ncbi:YSIRK-type signal peptide-containing protein [uncultured Lactobacillus sp.]|uniref:YSIRK-type signal peptide-containing protein n=1 Tax=uncultured Lactobacillus sp. TaxID=153152 RepID=UPI002805935B|nr:YSIRK-type signal peptide-containing protein [uncultured Lactobacillus sp.]